MNLGIHFALAWWIPGFIPRALLGIPGGIGLYSAVTRDGGPVTIPPLWWLAAAVLGTTAAVAAITIVPAWLGTRQPAGDLLQSELA